MTYIMRSSNVVQCDVQMRAAVLRGHFSSPALIPAVDYKMYPILCQLTFVPYTLHLWVLTCDQKYITMCWSQTSGSDAGSFLLHDVAAARTRTRRRARTTASSEDGRVVRNLRRSRMVKQRETKKHKMKKRSQKGLQLGNWWNLTQKQKRVFWPK